MSNISRRTILAGAATLGTTAITGINFVAPAKAAAPLSGKQASGFYRRKLGDFEITTIIDDIVVRDVVPGMVRNAELADVQKAAAAVSPDGKIRQPFAPIAVNTGTRLVLIDTGTGGRMMPTAHFMDNFTAAGFDTKSVDAIVVSHFHPDHINGIRAKDESILYPNAEIWVPAPEWAFWMSDDNMNKAPEAGRGMFTNVRRVFKDLGERVKQYEPGKEVVTGINSIATPGHTPGHTSFAISSGNQTLVTVVDVATVELFVRNPNWHLNFDSIPDLAEQTRKKLLDMLVTDKLLATGYHWPFPGASYVVKEGSGYRLVPAA